MIAGLPPIYGLYAALIPLLVYPFLGTSRQLITGPVAIDMLIVATGVSMLAAPGSAQYVALAVLLAGLVGLIQIGMGAARLGFLADLLSRPVIAGFTAAAALIIGFSQLGNLTGIDLPRSEYVHVILWEGAARLGQLPVLAAPGERVIELGVPVEMVLQRALAPAGDEDELLDAGGARLLDGVLDDRRVDHRQHLFGHCLGRRQEPGAQPGDREHGLGHRPDRRRSAARGDGPGGWGRCHDSGPSSIRHQTAAAAHRAPRAAGPGRRAPGCGGW